jgi:DNA-binding NtrC family response regulator
MNTVSTEFTSERTVLYVSAKADPSTVQALAQSTWRVVQAANTDDAKRALENNTIKVGLIELPRDATYEQIKALEGCARRVKISWIALVWPGQVEEEETRQFILDHCFDFVTLPCATPGLLFAIGHAHGLATLRDASPAPREERRRSGGRRAHGQYDMIGDCEAMRVLYRSIDRCVRTDAPVFISGESGTGKELGARAIHSRSARARQPFVAINCAAIPASLLQAELFGHERGAFTGALQQKIGRIESAAGGTLFLDEIGDMPYACQVVLLRFLQEGTIERLGSNAPIKINVRIVSATHVNLDTAVEEGKFRADLYHRLCVLRIVMPPLRERGKDIEELAHHALAQYKKEAQRKIRGFSDDALAALQHYDWPGNVRELFNCVRRAVVMAENPVITAADLDLRTMPGSLDDALSAARTDMEAPASAQHTPPSQISAEGAVAAPPDKARRQARHATSARNPAQACSAAVAGHRELA